MDGPVRAGAPPPLTVGELERALADGQLVYDDQPKVSLLTGEPVELRRAAGCRAS